MSIRKTSFVHGEYYHIYNRGNSKQKIFNDKEDYCRFIKLLFISNSQENFKIQFIGNNNIFEQDRGELLVSIGAWVIMPNHFHLIISQTENGSISKFMQKLTTAYSMYYNNKNERTGSLFEGKFKSKHITDDRYLKYLFSYVHLNPVKLIQKDWKDVGIKDKEGSLDFIQQYKYSSCLDYLKKDREENCIIDRSVFPNYFPTKEKFQNEIFEWISYRQDL